MHFLDSWRRTLERNITCFLLQSQGPALLTHLSRQWNNEDQIWVCIVRATVEPVHAHLKDGLWLHSQTLQRCTPRCGTAGPDWDACGTMIEGHKMELSCFVVWNTFSRITKKLYLILIHVMLFLTLSENYASLPLLSPRNKSCTSLRITRFTPQQIFGVHRHYIFLYLPNGFIFQMQSIYYFQSNMYCMT